MKNNLPNNWTEIKLGSIIKELNSGFACGVHNSTGDGISHLRPMNVTSKGTISLKDLRSVSATSYDKLVKGDVLFNNTNSTELVGKTAYIEEDTDWGYSNHMTRLRFNLDHINSKFVSYYLHNLFYEGYFRANCNNHVSQASISAKFLANEVSIPLPPFAEQNRIVAQLEATMQKIEASQERLENLPALLKKFRQAVLAAAVSGKLTEAWRAEQPQGETAEELIYRLLSTRNEKYEAELAFSREHKSPKPKKPQLENSSDTSISELPDLPDSWVWVDFATACEKIFDGTHFSPKSYPEGDYKYITAKNIKERGIQLTNITYLTSEDHAAIYARADVRLGDVLFIKDGATTGIATVNTLDEEFSLLSSVGVFRTNKEAILPEYVSYFLNSPDTRIRMLAEVAGIAITRLTLTKLNGSFLALPPFEEQQEIVRMVKHYFNLADQLEARFEQAAAMVEQLPQALLAKAFSGQLVPQDPNDEPASALLERLKTQAPAPAKGKRGRVPKAKTETPLFN